MVDDTLEFKNVIQCPNATPSQHPKTTAFGSIDTESNEWARDLCPTGLMSTVGKSDAKVTTASTVKGSTLLLLIYSIPS